MAMMDAGSLGQIQRDLYTVAGKVDEIAKSIGRLEGHLNSLFMTVTAAQSSQDTRIGELAVEIGTIQGANGAATRWHTGVIALVSGGISSLTTFFGTYLVAHHP
jgi:hypothetical protein